jgi:hypothetical protein
MYSVSTSASLEGTRQHENYLSWLAGVSTGVGSDITNFETLSSISLSESPMNGQSAGGLLVVALIVRTR